MSTKSFPFKLVLLGDTAVGKSSIVLRFVKKQFFEFQESTIGAAFLCQTVQLEDCVVKFEIWDTAGQERYHSLAPMYYRGAAAALIVYDITCKKSLERAKAWVEELQELQQGKMTLCLVGNKTDLEDQREVTVEEAKQYAEENDLLFMECSAKSASNINEIFTEIAEVLPKGVGPPKSAVGQAVIDDFLKPEDKSGGCCK